MVEQIKHEETKHGWTDQKSRCNFAGWWDCSFFCNKFSTKDKIVPCNFNVPDFGKCSKEGRMANLYKIEDLTPKQVASICDHTFLMPAEAYHEKAKEMKMTAAALREREFYNFLEFTVKTDLTPYAVCVRPEDVMHAERYLGAHGKGGIKIASVIGYPDGNLDLTHRKIMRVIESSLDCAAEIDPVIPYKALRLGNKNLVTNEMYQVIDTAHRVGTLVKYILENSELTPKLICEACKIADSCGSDFVKTNTGMGYSFAREEDLIIMKKNFPRGIKIAGGVVKDNYKSLLKAASGRSDGMIELDPMKIRIGESKLLTQLSAV